MVRRTKEEALATRQSLLDAAERLFHQRGVSRTSLHDIAAEAGVTRGAIYWHFEDKAALFSALMDGVCLPIEERVEDGAPDDDPLLAIQQHLLAVFSRVSQDGHARRVLEIATQKVEYVDELLAVRDRRIQARAAYTEWIARQLRRAQRQGLIGRELPVTQVALGLHALADGLLQNWLLDPKAFDLVKSGPPLVGRYLAGMAAVAEPSAIRRPAHVPV